MSLGVVYCLCIIIKEDGLKIFNFLFNVYKEGSKYVYRAQNVEARVPVRPTKFGIFIQNHINALIIFCAFFVILLELMQYHQRKISFIELLVWTILFIVLTIIASLPPKWIEIFKEKIRVKNTHLSLASAPSENSIEQQVNSDLIDAPLKDIRDDQFLRNSFTEEITNLIKNRKDPSSLVIGIYGEWGEGKTSVLNFIENNLEQNSDIVCVKYNPWRYNDEAQLLRNFFFTLSDALERSVSTRKERIGNCISKYATILSPVSIGIGGIIDVSPGEIFSNVGKAFSSVELEELKERIEKILDDEKKKIVIFIDDIDRLDRQEIQTLLKIVKLSADFRHTIYILAFDDEMVAAAFNERYGSGTNVIENNENGKRFLEKIIQIPLPLPKINDSILLGICLRGIENILATEKIQLSKEEIQQFGYQFNLGFFSHLKTPRLVKRYLNIISFSLPLLKNKINVSDLLLIEAIKVFRSSCFTTIRKHPEAFLGYEFNTLPNPEEVKKRYQTILDQMFEGEKNEFEKEVLKKILLHLFPRIQTIYGNLNYGPEWNLSWDKEKRVCSKRHLERYFAYTFPKGDISENDVTQFITTFSDMTETQFSEQIHAFTPDIQSANFFLFELRKNIKAIQSDKMSDFILALSMNSLHFPQTDSLLNLGPYSQLAVFLQELIIAIPKYPERVSLLRLICAKAQPFSFGFKILGRIEQNIKTDPNPPVISEEDFKELGKCLLDRMKGISLDYILSTNDTAVIFYSWSRFGSKNDIETFLSESFASNPKNVIPFLKCYISVAWNANGPVRGNLGRDAYNSIIRFCDPSIIYNALEKIYGDLSKADYREDTEIDEGLQIANQFSFMYHHKEKTNSELKTAESEKAHDDKI